MEEPLSWERPARPEAHSRTFSEVVAVAVVAFLAWAVWHQATDSGPAAPAPSHYTDTYVPQR